MPAPSKVTRSQIIAAGLVLLERNGREGFTMADVAEAVGVRSPSLYGHFADRAALLAELELTLWNELTKALAKRMIEGEPMKTLKAQAAAYRRFATEHPNGYALLFDVRSKHSEQGVRARTAAVNAALPAFAALVGDQQALVAARVLTPYLHGFVSMENAAGFRLGAGLDAAFEYGVETILRGLANAHNATGKPRPRKKGGAS